MVYCSVSATKTSNLRMYTKQRLMTNCSVVCVCFINQTHARTHMCDKQQQWNTTVPYFHYTPRNSQQDFDKKENRL